ncbi:alginate O-acetyltransferase AlgX-related protein [Deinococcus sonorensis]|uniref:AlgX/AlgJ SGNH hydrolase-like domain-containing protein n=2 Tax=Deinococcus sonorensis TaxID=309891 RepID=A0AAU7U4A8_9DEIO
MKLLVTALLLVSTPAAAQSIAGCDKIRHIGGDPKYEFFVQGQGGRLYSTFTFGRDFTQSTEQYASYYQRLNTLLARQGTHLIVAPAAPPALVNPEYVDWTDPLLADFDPQRDRANFRLFITELQRLGIAAFDYLTVTDRYKATTHRDDFLFRTDHHWTSLGAQYYAAALASYLKTTYAAELAKVPTHKYTIVQQGMTEHRFEDSYRRFAEIYCKVKFPAEKHPKFVLQAPADLGLLDDAPVIDWVVDSYGTPEYGFADQLTAQMGIPVSNDYIRGGGSDLPILQYFLSRPADQRPPLFLIWTSLDHFPRRETFYRQLLPSVYTKDQYAVAATTKDVKDGTLQLMAPPQVSLAGAQGFVRVTVPDVTVRQLDFTLSYADQQTEKVTLQRSDLIENTGVWYLELKAGSAPLKSVQVQADLGSSSAQLDLMAVR